MQLHPCYVFFFHQLVNYERYVKLFNFIQTSFTGIIQNKQEEVTNNTFTITAPTFSDDELYDFDWKVLKTSNQPFDVYTF